MKTFKKKSMPALLAFGAASAAGVLAAVLWAPASGRESRSRLATRLRTWAQPLTGRGQPRPGAQTSAASSRTGAGANLAMQPDHLLAKP